MWHQTSTANFADEITNKNHSKIIIMKITKLTFLIIIVLFCSCSSAYSPESLKENAGKLIDQEVSVSGYVTHVCSHSGKKCFLANEERNSSIQVIAGGEIKSFDKSLMGSRIIAKGILKEHRMPKENIEKSEKATSEEMQKEDCNNMEQCHSVLKDIKEMKEWMAQNNKDYYPIYYVEGSSYKSIK